MSPRGVVPLLKSLEYTKSISTRKVGLKRDSREVSREDFGERQKTKNDSINVVLYPSPSGML